MAVPSDGPLSMKGIFSEKNEDDYTAANMDGETSLSLRGLSSNSHDDTGSGGNINNNSDGWLAPTNTSGQTGANIQNLPYSASEFYGYDHDFVASNPFNGFSTSSPQTVPSGSFTVPNYGDASAGEAEEMGARIKITFGSSSFSYVVEDFSTESTNIGSGFSSNFFARSVTSQGASITWPENPVSTSRYYFTSLAGSTVSYNGGTDDVSKVEVRWVISGGRVDFQPGDDQDDYLRARYCTNYVDNTHPTPDTTTGQVVNIVRGNADNLNVSYTDSWRTVTPTVFGGSSATGNVVLCDLYCQTRTDTTGSERIEFRLNSGGSIELQIRVTKTNNSTYTYVLRKPYVSTTEPLFRGESDDD